MAMSGEFLRKLRGILPAGTIEWVGALFHFVHEKGVHGGAGEVGPVRPQPEEDAVDGLRRNFFKKGTENQRNPQGYLLLLCRLHPTLEILQVAPLQLKESEVTCHLVLAVPDCCCLLHRKTSHGKFREILRFPYLGFVLHVAESVTLLDEEVFDPSLAFLQAVEVALELAKPDDCGEK